MGTTTYGYARVSTGGQDLEPQLRALRAAGCGTLVKETASGADRDRPELARLLARLRPGDALVVVRIDRLARSLAHLLEVIDRVAAAGARFRSLSDPIDTGSPTGRLVLQVIGAIAEFERNLISERTKAGLAVARARGRAPGNPGLRAREPAAVRRAADAQHRARLERLLADPHLDAWLGAVRRSRAAGEPWARAARAADAARRGAAAAAPSPAPAAAAFTPRRLRDAVALLAREGLCDRALLRPAPRGGRAAAPETREAAVAAARFLRRHRREAEGHHGGAVPPGYRPPTLREVAEHLERDAGLRPPGGGAAWSPSSVSALLRRRPNGGPRPA